MTRKTIIHDGIEYTEVTMDDLIGELTPEAKAERFRKIAAELDRRKHEEEGPPKPPQKDSDCQCFTTKIHS